MVSVLTRVPNLISFGLEVLYCKTDALNLRGIPELARYFMDSQCVTFDEFASMKNT